MNACLNSGWQFDLSVLLTLLVCVAGIVLVFWTLRRDFPGRPSFILVVLAGLWWMLTTGLEVVAAAPDCKLFWAAMSWPGVVTLSTVWAVFLWQYVNGARKPLIASVVQVLMVVPVLVCLMALSNPWHELFYSAQTGPLSLEPGAPIQYHYGPLFYFAVLYCNLFMLFSIATTLRAVASSRGLYRQHYLGFVLISLLPWLINIFYLVFAWTLFGVNPTPFSVVVALALFSWLILHSRLFDLWPVTWDLLLEVLEDPVLVIDGGCRVIEANQAALQLVPDNLSWQGGKLQDWPDIGPDLSTLLSGLADNQEQQEHLLKLGGATRYFEVRIRDIERADRAERVVLGRMLYLRDVTQRHLSELKLVEALALSEERLNTIASLHEKLQMQALCDPLTGLYNRRYLDDLFARELARAQRERTSLALALIDLDRFKLINDQYGHQEGDDVLKSVAQHLRVSVRASDAVFRIGGEEFLLILPGADTPEAQLRLESICRTLAEQPVVTRTGLRHVTLSAGLACWPEHGEDLDQLMHRADSALYEAKHSGRNCVRVPSGDAPVA